MPSWRKMSWNWRRKMKTMRSWKMTKSWMSLWM
jgi:hypothetical protein